MWRNLKFLHMWSNFKFCHMKDVEKSEISPHLAGVWNWKISPHMYNLCRFVLNSTLLKFTLFCRNLRNFVRRLEKNWNQKLHMWRHFPHHTHARCGEISDFSSGESPHLLWGEIWNYSTCGENLDFSTSVMWRDVKLLHMWRNIRILHICHA